MNRGSVLVVLILASTCGHKVQTKRPNAPPEDELLYRQGVEAFRQATPEGYEQAIHAFRQASSLAKSRCEYSLHLAEVIRVDINNCNGQTSLHCLWRSNDSAAQPP